jgi:hypothetical protein
LSRARSRGSVRDKGIYLQSDELGGQWNISIASAEAISLFYYEVGTLYPSQFSEALAERIQRESFWSGKQPSEPDCMRRLLPLGGERRDEETTRYGADEGSSSDH